jgi:hypothetical protein
MDRTALLKTGRAMSSDGTVRIPRSAVVKLIPIAKYYEIRILLDGQSLRAVIHQSALKLCADDQKTTVPRTP